MNRFKLVLISGVVLLSSCNVENSETRKSAAKPNVTSSTSAVSETSSTTPISSATLSYSASTEENSSAPKKIWLAETLPPLTKEEICKKDTLVPAELWEEIDGWHMYEPESNIEAYSMHDVLEKQFGKPLAEVTYEELWRYNNAGEEWDIWPVSLDDNTDDQFPAIFKEFRSISDILFNPYVVSQKGDWSNLAAMTWLKKLKIWGGNVSMLSDLPAEIKSLVNLEVLDLRFNRLEKLPDIFDSFPKLEYLNLDYNRITELPPSAYRLKNLEYLNLDNSDFGVVPASISQLQSLEELSIASHIYEISDEISNLANLKILKLGQWGNRYHGVPNPPKQALLDHLPENIGNLDKLEVLVMASLPIKSLPASFVNLKSLRDITTNEVPLENLPENIGNLTSLEGVEFICDQIKELPESFKELPNIAGAKFSDEQVTAKAKEMIRDK